MATWIRRRKTRTGARIFNNRRRIVPMPARARFVPASARRKGIHLSSVTVSPAHCPRPDQSPCSRRPNPHGNSEATPPRRPAEFLAPSCALRKRIRSSVVAEEEIGGLVRELGVSSFVIEHQFESHGIARIWSPSRRIAGMLRMVGRHATGRLIRVCLIHHHPGPPAGTRAFPSDFAGLSAHSCIPSKTT